MLSVYLINFYLAQYHFRSVKKTNPLCLEFLNGHLLSCYMKAMKYYAGFHSNNTMPGALTSRESEMIAPDVTLTYIECKINNERCIPLYFHYAGFACVCVCVSLSFSLSLSLSLSLSRSYSLSCQVRCKS